MTYGVYFENLFRVFEATQSIFSKLFMSHVNESKAYLVNSQAVKVNPPTETHSVIPGFLPCHFDIPNSDGWAGCSAQEAGQPEPIRINLNKVLGQGANGTMVFAFSCLFSMLGVVLLFIGGSSNRVFSLMHILHVLTSCMLSKLQFTGDYMAYPLFEVAPP
ncbi:unnamed protein product [Trichobilharzia regenti]|nr:unnamed protein product [Trichobilharzia regenti]